MWKFSMQTFLFCVLVTDFKKWSIKYLYSGLKFLLHAISFSEVCGKGSRWRTSGKHNYSLNFTIEIGGRKSLVWTDDVGGSKRKVGHEIAIDTAAFFLLSVECWHGIGSCSTPLWYHKLYLSLKKSFSFYILCFWLSTAVWQVQILLYGKIK